MTKLTNIVDNPEDGEAAAEPSNPPREGKIVYASASLCGESRMRARAVPVWSEWKVMAAVPTRRSPIFRQPRRLDRRLCGGRPRAQAARSSAKSGDSGEDPPNPGAGDPDGRSPQLLLSDLTNYLERLDPYLGCERTWLVDQVAFLGHHRWRVRVGIALLVSQRLARAAVAEDGTEVIWGSPELVEGVGS